MEGLSFLEESVSVTEIVSVFSFVAGVVGLTVSVDAGVVTGVSVVVGISTTGVSTGVGAGDSSGVFSVVVGVTLITADTSVVLGSNEYDNIF